MNDKDHIYTVKLGKIELDNGKYFDRWFILQNAIPVFEINEWLEEKSIRKIATGKKYAYNICRFLNFLAKRGIAFKEATRKDVILFIDSLVFGINESLAYINPDGQMTYSTLCGYISAITELYKFLEDEQIDTKMGIRKKLGYLNASKNFLYGQIWSINTRYIIEERARRLKGSNEYIKWYTDNEKKSLLDNFLTLRDRAVFLLTTEGGFRIDEAISVRLIDYNQNDLVIRPYRSKLKFEGEGRPVVLSENTCDVLNSYIWNERNKVEAETGIISECLFINLRRGQSQGLPLRYESYLQILKRCAQRSGFDPSMIRSHSGRSTKTMELLHTQAEHPELNLTDEMIRQIMGWRSPNSIIPYRNLQDIRLATSAAKKIKQIKSK